MSDHPQNVPDVQRLSYTYNPTFDEYKVKLHKTGKPVDSVFKLVFKVDGEEGQVNFPVEWVNSIGVRFYVIKANKVSVLESLPKFKLLDLFYTRPL